MKVDSKHIAELFTELKSLILGVQETIQMGDDGFEDSINSICADMYKMLGLFQIDHMTPPVKEIKREHRFLSKWLELDDKAKSGAGLSPTENELLFQARLYAFINKKLSDIDITEVADNEIQYFIIDNIIAGTSHEYHFKTAFSRDLDYIIDLVAKEVLENRRKFPQLVMNLNQKAEKPSELLIDKL